MRAQSHPARCPLPQPGEGPAPIAKHAAAEKAGGVELEGKRRMDHSFFLHEIMTPMDRTDMEIGFRRQINEVPARDSPE
jgi:hypothetical protein